MIGPSTDGGYYLIGIKRAHRRLFDDIAWSSEHVLRQTLARADELGLPIAGLMCIPPVEEEPGLHFALLREIAGRNGLAGLSMGMSSDFETAIRYGATHIRVGTAIFGERVPAPAPREGR